jgi:hypothetical protein
MNLKRGMMSEASEMLTEEGAAYLAGLLEGLQPHNKRTQIYDVRLDTPPVIIGYLSKYGELRFIGRNGNGPKNRSRWIFLPDPDTRTRLSKYFQFILPQTLR